MEVGSNCASLHPIGQQNSNSSDMERERRVNKEIQDLQKLDTSGSDISVKSIPGEKFHFKGHLKGPSDTPYEGGAFVVDIVLPNEYPFMPPKMKFDTKVWHPNISSQTGAICLGAASSPKPRIKYPFY
jgi:ubiquitin-protein ligase